jgi:phosphomannomutase/phosphoglucomutase
MILSKKIFRAYDIRGEAFTDFDEDGFFLIARTFGQYIAKKHNLKNPKIFVSGDGRISMGELYPAVIAGLEASSCEVIWGGVIPTPVTFFALHEGNFDAVIQISASHNPAQDNGLKLVDRTGSVCGNEIQKIKEMTECINCLDRGKLGHCNNNCEISDYKSKYLKKLLNITSTQSSKKIVVDAGNGVAGIIYPDVFKKFGHNVIELFCDLDTSFPNHHPDPERPENLKDLVKKVQAENADFGFSYDGDGDRVGVVLKDGTILNADKIIYILTADYLTRNPGEKIILDAMTSQTLIEKIKGLGGVPILSKTGHSFIEETMYKLKAKLGGEQSGHFMFGENFYGHDDACLASLKFLEAVENNPKLIDDVTVNWSNFLEFSEKITVNDELKFKILDKVVEKLKKILPTNSINDLDGIRINFANIKDENLVGKNKAGEWAIIRCSNTSPKISIRIEAKNKQSLTLKSEFLVNILNSFL